MNYQNRLHLSFLLILINFGTSTAYSQTDFDKDGLQEVVVTQVEADKQLRWLANELQSNEVIDLGLFGQEGLQTNVGYWKEPGVPTRALVRQDDNAQFQLIVEDYATNVTLGASKARSYVLLGRDINDTGTADAVLIDGERKLWSWKFLFDPFSKEGTNYKRSLFGRLNGSPFLFKGRGRYDSLAVLEGSGKRSSTIRYRGLNNKKLIRTIRLKKAITAENVAPQVLRNSAGIDNFVFTEEQDTSTTAFTVNPRGRVIATSNFPPNVTVVTGYFSTTDQEELAYIKDQNLAIGENSEQQLPLSGELTIKGPKEYKGQEEYSPTPLATIVSTATTSATIIVTAAPTYTVAPTYTPLPTSTATVTSTPTATGTPTATATPTATPTPIEYIPNVHGDGQFDFDLEFLNYNTSLWPTATPVP